MKRCIYISYQIFSIFNSCKIFNIYLNIAAEKPFSGSAINFKKKKKKKKKNDGQ